MLNGTKIPKVASKIGKILNYQNTFRIWPKWRNFAKSGHTALRKKNIR